MTAPYFFGYGSLVNRRTHSYQDAHRARIAGWRRTWRHIQAHETAYLVVEPNTGCSIEGLIAAVPGADWQALDKREEFYVRIQAIDVSHPLENTSVEMYHSPPSLNTQSDQMKPILLSYLDVVVQGYHTEFGVDGVTDFFATTEGWDAPVLDDRANPRYPRHQILTPSETALVDQSLDQKGVTILPG